MTNAEKYFENLEGFCVEKGQANNIPSHGLLLCNLAMNKLNALRTCSMKLP